MATKTSSTKKLFALLLAISMIFSVFSIIVSAADFGNYSSDKCATCQGSGGADHSCADCAIPCSHCGGDGRDWYGNCIYCKSGVSGYSGCEQHACSACEGSGKSYYAEHLDIAFDVYASVLINGTVKTVNFEITADDYLEGRISVSGGSVESIGSDTYGNQNDLRLNGRFPIGTPSNPVSYTVTLSNKKIIVDGVEVIFSSTINDITAWGSNSCPSGVGIDVAFGNVDGTPETPELTAGSLTIFKAVSGVTLAEDQTYAFTVVNEAGASTAVSVKVPAGNLAGSTTVELPFGTYTVSEDTPADIVIGNDTYNFVSTEITYPDSTSSFTLSPNNYARQVNVINTYEKATIDPPAITEGTVTVTKIISGVTPANDTTYSFTVGNTPVSVVVKAGQTTGSASVTLPFGTYEIAEITAEMADVVGANGKAYEFVSASAAQSVTISDSALTASASFTNTYEEKITEGAVTITKVVSGVTLAEDTVFSFLLTGTNVNRTVNIKVAAGQSSATSDAIVLPLGTYTVQEITEAVATLTDSADEVYELISTTGDTALTLTKAQVSDTATITNTYAHKVTKGDLRITKAISGMTPAVDTTYSFTVIGENINETVSVVVKAGETTGTVLLEKLPLGSYTVEEVTPATTLNGTDGKTYNFLRTVYSKETATITATAGDSVTVTNFYEAKITEGTVTVTKIVAGVAPANDTTYSFTVGNTPVSVVVKAGQTTGSTSVTLPFGTYEISEITTEMADILGTDGKTYAFVSASATQSVTISDSALTASAAFTNTYEGKLTEGTVTITKIVTGVIPAANTAYNFTVGNTLVSVVVKAGYTSGSASVTLPFGTYEIAEITSNMYDVLGVDGEGYRFVSASDAQSVTLSENALSATASFTNIYEHIVSNIEPINDDPIETEPVETKPVETEPVETEPVETEPVETEPVEEIDDEEVPLTDIDDEPVPQTGFSIVWYVTALFSGAGLAVVSVADKKKKTENK